VIIPLQVAALKTPLNDGWGLTSGNGSLIASDGSANIFFLDPKTIQSEQTLLTKFFLLSLVRRDCFTLCCLRSETESVGTWKKHAEPKVYML
jgi:hypothetical protein